MSDTPEREGIKQRKRKLDEQLKSAFTALRRDLDERELKLRQNIERLYEGYDNEQIEKTRDRNGVSKPDPFKVYESWQTDKLPKHISAFLAQLDVSDSALLGGREKSEPFAECSRSSRTASLSEVDIEDGEIVVARPPLDAIKRQTTDVADEPGSFLYSELESTPTMEPMPESVEVDLGRRATTDALAAIDLDASIGLDASIPLDAALAPPPAFIERQTTDMTDGGVVFAVDSESADGIGLGLVDLELPKGPMTRQITDHALEDEDVVGKSTPVVGVEINALVSTSFGKRSSGSSHSASS